MSARGDAFALVAGLTVVVALTLARPVAMPPSTYSSYDTGPDGYRAIYEVMRREGVRVDRFEGEVGTLRATRATLVVSPSDVEGEQSRASSWIDPGDGARLARFVRAGGRLVALGDVLQFAGSALALPPVASISPAAFAVRAAKGPFSDGVRRVEAPFATAFSHLRRGVERVLTVRGAPVAVAYRLGRGSVGAITAAGVFSNASLARAQNARFAYDTLSGSGPLLFDERLHGYASGDSMWGVLPNSVHAALWTALGVLVLAVAGGLARSAPPMALEPPRLRDSSAYVASMAALLQRARAGSAAIDRFARDAMRRAGARPVRARDANVRRDLEALAELNRRPAVDDARVLEAARLNARLRKELA